MDCEKCEPLLLDELYEELDEVTSAAVKRHVSGCARCGPILDGMRSTRRLVALPLARSMVAVPDGLEDRILSSVKEAQKVVPIQSRASRALSWAGSWAMRPQTAMAAVFLLMIGTSAFVIRSRHSSERAAAVSVTEQGEPAGQSVPADDLQSLDSKAAAAAHGANVPAPITAPPVVAATASPMASSGNTASTSLAFNNDPMAGSGGSAGPLDGITAGKGRAAKEDDAIGSALGASAAEKADKNKDRDEESQARGGEKKSGNAQRAQANRAPEITNAAPPAGAPNDYAPRAQTVSPPATKTAGDQPQDGFSAGMAAYRSRNFSEATRQFDTAARSGDQNAALWAAKSVKDSPAGCGGALTRFESVAQKGPGTWVGNEAQLEAARCQIANGQLDAARDRLTKLSSVPSHAAPAQAALAELNQVASRREAERTKRAAGAGGGSMARPAAPAPVRAPAKPAATVDRGSDSNSNKASGF